jgi:uncharacterized repeat protein (TIGR03803 family)
MGQRRTPNLLNLLWLLPMLCFGSPCRAQVTEQTIKSFGFANLSDGSPSSLIVGKDGALYGTTTTGGAYSEGSVFRLSADGTSYAQLHSFGAGSDGYNPGNLMQGADGRLYGLTTYGGTNTEGTVFSLRTDGSDYALIYQFNFATDGSGQPQGLTQGPDGWLYGTASHGGSNFVGSVFKLSTDGANYAILHHFSSSGGDGTDPEGALAVTRDGVLYGATSGGGNASAGTVFQLNTDGSAYSVLYNFTNQVGGQPQSGVVLGADGALYGTAFQGGASNYGTIFRLATDGPSCATLHTFTATLGDGGLPSVPLVLGPDGSLYGATLIGGALDQEGAIFKLSTDGSNYRILYKFAVNYPSQDGSQPNALALSASGTLYGTTRYGGSTSIGSLDRGDGTVFAISTNGGSYAASDAVIYNFNVSGGDGATPVAALISGRDGSLFGTTQSGGDHNVGTLFRLSPTGSGYSVLYHFGNSSIDGRQPLSALVQGLDGALYGAAPDGGYNSAGTLFKINQDGSGYAPLHSFGFLVGEDGSQPIGLLQGTDGMLYGITQDSYNVGSGTIIQLDTSGGNYHLLYSFTNNLTGAGPQAALIQGSDGFLYGTTAYGGSNSMGVVFKVGTDANGYAVLHNFGSDPLDGFGSPAAPLVQGVDGMLYGTTQYGGTNNAGAIFKVSTTGTSYSVLHGFRAAFFGDGQSPNGLVQGTDGALYGTTLYGGTNSDSLHAQGDGTLFKINTNGSDYTILYHFGGAPNDGINPQAGLIQAAGGLFYGTTAAGGAQGLGTVFRYGPTPLQFTSAARLPDGTVQLALTGATNTTCRLDASTDLIGWVTLTNIPNVTGTIQFLDLDAPSFPKRFYRGLQTP